MENSTLLAKFEVAYKEFKEYGAYFFESLKDFREKTANQMQYFSENIDDKEKIYDYIFESTNIPQLHANDLDKLKERLITIYETIEDVVEIPEEIRTEMLEVGIKKNPILYKIIDGKAEPVNKELIEQVRSNMRKLLPSVDKLINN